MTLTYKESMEIIGGLSGPSKMPWYAWSISALDCKTGTKLREIAGSVCDDCYAMKGNYRFRNVKEAHQRRLNALGDPRFVEAFVTVLTVLYSKSTKTYKVGRKKIKENRFRWHDAGDLQNLDHLKKINSVAEQTPFLIHWLPTREIGIVNAFIKSGGKFAPNLLVRISATMVGQTYPTRPMGLPFSTVGLDTAPNQCPAYSQGGECRNCSNCWNPNLDVNYPLH